MKPVPRRQRVAAYATIVREGSVLLARIAPRISADEVWTLPGGGLNHGEDPAHAVVREVWEETGLQVRVAPEARVYSWHAGLSGEDGGDPHDYHALRIVYRGHVPKDSPAPSVQEIDGSTVEAAWKPLADVRSGAVPTVRLVREALADLEPDRLQRLAAYGLIERGGAVLLTRISPRGHHAGFWTLPGGGVDHGESPRAAVAREIGEETGLEVEVGELLDVHDVHFTGTAPSGREEDFHGVHLIFAATAPGTGGTGGDTGTDAGTDSGLRVVEADGTTDEVAWVDRERIAAGEVPVLDLVLHALGLR